MSPGSGGLLLAAATILTAMTGVGTAWAVPAEVINATNVHVRPSFNSTVVDRLYEGEIVDLRRCADRWCYVTHRGPDGWVPARFLSRLGGGYSVGPDYDSPPVIIIDPGFGHGHPPPPPPKPPKPPFHPVFPNGKPPSQFPLQPIHPVPPPPTGGPGKPPHVNPCLLNPSLPQCGNFHPK